MNRMLLIYMFSISLLIEVRRPSFSCEEEEGFISAASGRLFEPTVPSSSPLEEKEGEWEIQSILPQGHSVCPRKGRCPYSQHLAGREAQPLGPQFPQPQKEGKWVMASGRSPI